MLIRELRKLRPIDIRIALYVDGDIDEVEHDLFWSHKLNIPLFELMETR